ncbi:MAG: hypothetical protein Q9196_003669 [Gyalolechia fulgens]
MKVNNYFTTALGMIAALPGYSVELTLPKHAHNRPVPEALSHFPGRPCHPEDHVFGCLLPPDAKPRSCGEDSKYFDAANWDESGAGQAYIQWVQTIDQSSAAWTSRTSEPNFFMEQVLNWQDFDCGAGLHGCDMKPSCDEILTRLGDKDKARKVYFILKSMENLSLITSVVAVSHQHDSLLWLRRGTNVEQEQSVTVEVDLALMSESIAHTFLWKYDENVQRKCELMAGLAKAAIMTLFVIIAAVAAPEAAAAGATAGIGGLTVRPGAAIATNIAAKSSPWTYAQIVNGVKTYYVSSGAGQLELASKFASNFPITVGGDGLTRSICSHFPNAPKTFEKEAKLAIDKLIRSSSEEYRTMIEQTNSDLIRGMGFSEDAALLLGHGTVLANVLQFGAYVELSREQHKRFVEQPALIEQDMKAQFKNAVVSTVLKSQMCYLHCSSSASTQPDRTRFETAEGRFCEAKCWQNWSGEKELKLFGLEELVKDDGQWNIDLLDYLKASYDHFKAHGYEGETINPSVEDLYEGKTTSTSGSFLPVCDTYLPPDKDGSMPKGMPCACGDKYGSDTAAFWKEANFDSWVADKSPGPKETHKGTIYLCRNELANIRAPPVTYFLNMCNAGWHWPYKWESWVSPWDVPGAFDPPYTGTDDYLIQGADEKCDEFQAKVDHINRQGFNGYAVTEQALNCEMCFLDDLGIYIKENQTPNIENFDAPDYAYGLDYNFKRACKLYREKYHCDPGLDPSKRAKSNATDLGP